MIPITINHQAITQSSPLVKGGAPEGGQTGKKEGGERRGLELTVKNISLEVFSFKPLCHK